MPSHITQLTKSPHVQEQKKIATALSLTAGPKWLYTVGDTFCIYLYICSRLTELPDSAERETKTEQM